MSLKFSKEHEWVNAAQPEAAIVGITVHAQDALGDVVFVDLPAVGTTFQQGDVTGVVESVKAAADVFMPVTGEIVEVNEALRADPDRNRAILDRIPAGRWGRAEDIGQTAVFLSAPASDYVNGAILNVDGGWLAR